MKPVQKSSMVFLIPNEYSAAFKDGDTVLEVAQARQIELASSCGGMGSCGTCRVVIESDLQALPERNEVEQEIATDRGFAPAERLACQLLAFPGLCARVSDDPDLNSDREIDT